MYQKYIQKIMHKLIKQIKWNKQNHKMFKWKWQKDKLYKSRILIKDNKWYKG